MAVLLGWGLVAHNSGAGWVQAIGDVLAGTLAVGLLAPGVVTARASVRVDATPADGTAGLPVELTVTARTRLRVRPLDPPGPESFVGPRGSWRLAPGRGAAFGHRSGPGGAEAYDRGGAGDGEVTLVPEHRGVHDAITLEIASAAPFGLLWWRRTVVVALPRQLHVRPRLGVPRPLPAGRDDTGGDGSQRAPVQVGEPRGVRPYRPGDQRRWVHWPATAHAGELMVRDMEGPTTGPVSVEVRLPGDPEAAERAAERALGTVVALVDAGTPVVLRTNEVDGPSIGTVGDRRSAGRRLARAVAEPEP
ncbi:MAG: DUF58 domain-containing protein [Acidimicrobiales bacterium]